jgi:hypothetical protein
MDPLAQAHFENKFELKFLKSQGDEFQKFFGRIMSMAHPGDFVQTRPWGKFGDEKCDGYLRSERRFYQCYAPEDLKKAETLRKLNEDFNGSLPHAGEFFRTWIFVHNSKDGLVPTWLIKEIESLQKKYPIVKIEILGFEELRQKAFSLSNQDLVSLLGPPINQRVMMSLGMKEIRPLLAHLEQNARPIDEEPKPVSADKLTYNSLSSNVEALLKAGMTKTKLVEEYLARTANKELGDKISSGFRNEYRALREDRLGGNEIFDRLWQYAIGPYRGENKSEVAGLAILAYLFEACDIFENAP